MIKFPYYFVCKLNKDSDGNQLPEILHCVFREGKFYKIDSLEKYLKTGEGVSESIVEKHGGFLLVNDVRTERSFTF